ncbi:MAG TPA: DUF1573 domain-containing protein [Arachidicoccus sp.]
MYKILILIFAIVFCSNIHAQIIKHAPPVDGYKYVTIDDADHNFGDIIYGKPVSYAVKMKNISQDTLILTNIIVSCGCTTPQYKAGAYAPGSEIDLTIGFNGYDKGNFSKSMSVLFQNGKVGQIVKIVRFHGNGIVQNQAIN